MSATVLPLDGDGHHAARALLPWYAAGTLPAQDAALLEVHLATCAECRRELDWDLRLCELRDVPFDLPANPEQGLAELRHRISQRPSRPSGPSRTSRPSGAVPNAPARAGPSAAWRWLLGGQFAAMAALVAMVAWRAPPAAEFHAMGRPAAGAAAANLVVRFRADATERDIRNALVAAGARLVDGPTVTDAYLLAVVAGQQEVAASRLRGERCVLLAESLEMGPPP